MATLDWEKALSALAPLRVRAHQLQLQAEREYNAEIQRWNQSEKPVLKEHAAGLKETLLVLSQEEAILQQRLANLATSTVPNHPGTSTGFNVIRARVDSLGQPLSTVALKAERDRLAQTIVALEVEIASANAEIMQHRRLEELEIWETKLVALQDTKRVYREEINLIEVELLGREHYERMEHERMQAESTGEAKLRRLQEQMLQTRIKYNRAKYQYYFPKLKGWNITFGGGGIFGACKDIGISEIHGAVAMRAEPGGMGEDGVYRPARMTVQFEAAGGDKLQGVKKTSSVHRAETNSVSSGGTGSFSGAGNGRPNSAAYPPPKPRASSAKPDAPPARQSGDAQLRMQRLSVQDNDLALPRRAVSTPRDDAAAPPGGTGPGAPSSSIPASLPQQDQQYSDSTGPEPVEGARRRGFATRFLKKLGSKKERFQGKQAPHLQPARDEDDLGDGSKQKRSLASKLLSRKSSRVGSQASSATSLERLAFAGHQLTDGARREGSNAGISLDDEASMQHSGSAGDASDYEDDGVLQAVPEHGGQSTVEEHDDGDGSLASDESSSDDEGGANGAPSPLTHESLRRAQGQRQPVAQENNAGSTGGGGGPLAPSSGKGSWLRGAGGTSAGGGFDGASALDDGASSVVELGDAEAGPGGASGSGFVAPRGVFLSGRLKGFDLVGERGSKVPNLIIGQADVRATVYVRFVFEFDKGLGWKPGTRPTDRPLFHVENLKYSIKGNNVPMPAGLIKHILRMAIPGLIQRRLLGLLPRELGQYLLSVKRGFKAVADVGLVGPALAVLDADLGFEVKGPARSAKDARREQAKYASAKEARSLLGLSLPQAQVLAELFSGAAALLDPPRPASITTLIHLQATHERNPRIYHQLCQVIDTSYHVLAQARGQRADEGEFSFPGFMAGPVARMRCKPARTRVVMRSMDLALNADAILTALHDFTQRTIEDMMIKGPLADPSATEQSMRAAVEEELEVLHAWHAFALQELQHFKSKFRGGAGTVLTAADSRGFSLGIENCHYEGPLRLRLPVAMRLDQDGAISFDLPLPGPTGKLGLFMDNFKALTVPCHLRPPAQAVNWVELTEDSEVDARMKAQVIQGLDLIRGVLEDLATKIAANGLEKDDEDADKALSQPRTMTGDRLGRLIVNRLKVRVRLDERRIGEILGGLDKASMGGDGAFTATAGRIIGHLGDVLTMGFTPAAADPGPVGSTAARSASAPDRYLFQLESSDISRLRAEVQSLGFQSAVTPGGAVRLVHAVMRAAKLAFMERPQEELDAYRESMKGWYRMMTREELDVSMCLDTKGEVQEGKFMVFVSGTADQAALRATSPLVLTNEIDLVSLGKAMRGDPPAPPPGQQPSR